MSLEALGPYPINTVIEGDCFALAKQLPSDSVDLIITSPPYWGQRTSLGTGVESDPREYLASLVQIFEVLLEKLKPQGLLWINIGDAYNTPVNWRPDSAHAYSTLGSYKTGLSLANSAYQKSRDCRKAFVDKTVNWLSYGNLLALPFRLVIALCDLGYLYRGEVIWHKKNPLPEGRCRRPHRAHESIFLFAKQEGHKFKITPPVQSVWQFGNEKIVGLAHSSRFPEELPTRCIEAYSEKDSDVVVLDPFSGSGTTGVAARKLGCSYLGFEIDPDQVTASNQRIGQLPGIRVPFGTKLDFFGDDE